MGVMKASELRIGNFINGFYYKYGDEDEQDELKTICTVTTLDDGSMGDYPIYVESDEDIEVFVNFEGIPLTEEWLLKFGFEKSKTSSQFDKEKLTIQIANELEYHKKGRTYFNSWAILEESPKYVHQLQNLYFALIGEELKITKP
jgi:hypothetical protein